MSAVSPQEGDQQAGEEKNEREEDIEEMFTRVFEESVDDTSEGLQETSDEAIRVRARRTEAEPSAKEVEEHDLDHSVSGVGARVV